MSNVVYDPFEDLYVRHPSWRVRVVDLEEGYLGVTDFDHRTVWLTEGQPTDQLIATMAHEVVHVDLGHDRRQHRATENAVDVIAASRLLSSRTANARRYVDPDLRRAWQLAVRRAERRRRTP